MYDFVYRDAVKRLKCRLEKDLERTPGGQDDGVDYRINLRSKYRKDLRYVSSLAKLNKWCHRHKLKIQYETNLSRSPDCTPAMLRDRCRVCLDPIMCVRNQLYCALHEVGHVLTDERIKRSGVDFFPYGACESSSTKREGRTWLHRLDIVGEEIEAWNQGRELAYKLNLEFNYRDFDQLRGRMLKSYCSWALKVNGFGKLNILQSEEVSSPQVACSDFSCHAEEGPQPPQTLERDQSLAQKTQSTDQLPQPEGHQSSRQSP